MELAEDGVKSRRHYASIDVRSMGVPAVSPTEAENSIDYEEMSVDYSAQDFRQSLSAINDATRVPGAALAGIRVRQEGDTTITTEHRDPYSFYWKMDAFRQPEPEPQRQHHYPPPNAPRPPPPPPPLPPPPPPPQQQDNHIEEVIRENP